MFRILRFSKTKKMQNQKLLCVAITTHLTIIASAFSLRKKPVRNIPALVRISK